MRMEWAKGAAVVRSYRPAGAAVMAIDIRRGGRDVLNLKFMDKERAEAP